MSGYLSQNQTAMTFGLDTGPTVRMEMKMSDEYTIVRFEGDGPFVLPSACGPIKVCTIEGSADLLFEWPLPPVPEQTQKIVQLQVAPEYAMALMLVLQKAQKELGLAVPKGQTTDRRFQ